MMDVDEGGGSGMGDSGEQFHRNEAISAVVDEGFLAEEEDDYEDLYNDVNVGENFLQSLRKNEDPPAPVEKKVEITQTPAPLPPPPPKSVAESGGGEERRFERIEEDGTGSRASGRGGTEGYENSMGYIVPGGPSGTGRSGTPGGGGFRVELTQSSAKVGDLDEQTVSNSVPNQPMVPQHHVVSVGNVGHVANVGNDSVMRQGGGNMNGASGPLGGGIVTGGGSAIGSGGNGTFLFVGDLHWWTTDAELEEELSKYGSVKEVKFFDEKASGKSKGYCQVEFYDSSHATACKEGMNGHMFNGRPCVVAYASPFTVKKMGEAQVNRNQPGAAQANVNQGRRGPGDGVGGRTGGSNIATGGNYQGAPDNNGRGYARGNWNRGGGQGMGGGRGPVGPMRNRGGGIGGRGIMGNGGNGFGQGMGATPPMMHPNSMMGQGFDPGFGGPLGRMGGYGGFPGGPAPFSGILSSFPPVGNVGLPGVAPHVNPAFFGRGMPMNGMGMMPNSGMDGPNMGMWADPNMGGWTGEEHGGGRAGESSYGEEAVSDHQYEESHDRGAWPGGGMKEKDRGSERARSGSSDRRYREDRKACYERDIPREKETGHDHDWSEKRHHDDRDIGRDRARDPEREHDRDRDREHDRDRDREHDRDRHRDDRDKHSEHHRSRERESEYDNEWERGRTSRTHSKSRVSHREERSRSRDADYGKRRRVTSD